MTQPHQSEDATMKPVACWGLSSFCAEVGRKCAAAGACVYEPPIDRGPLTQPAELTDQSAWDAFDLERGGPGKGERLARRDDQQAAALDLQALDVMRKVGAL